MSGKYDIDTIRHSCAHVMAAAISEVYGGAVFGVGPTTENGFYYDVVCNEVIGEGNFDVIEAKMSEIRASGAEFVRSEVGVAEAIELFGQNGQIFKVRLLEMLQKHGSTAILAAVGDGAVVGDGVESVSLYSTGDFVDLCRGPHVGAAGDIGHFKLLSVAGAYWRGDSNAEQLQRIYGICFRTKSELNSEIERLEEVKLRDHRVLGARHKFFASSPDVGAGLPLWLPAGTAVRDELEYLAKETEARAGYLRVSTPHLASADLYRKSGHLPYYRGDMYSPVDIGGREFFLKPMNCPHHHCIYLSDKRSYRDLPLRLAEYGQVYRYEDSGALSGIMRTRGFCQNDSHIYCSYGNAEDEFVSVLDLHRRYYDLLGIEDYYMRLSLPDMSNLGKYVDDPKGWEAALGVVIGAMERSGLAYEEAPGDAAFYGPKVDFIIKSVVGEEYAISTSQLDFLSSSRFGLSYVGADGGEHPVYVIHRAPLGSHERMVAFLLEHYKAAFPFWLAPEQIRILPVTDDAEGYAVEVSEAILRQKVSNGSSCLRASVDKSGGRLGKIVRGAVEDRVPMTWIVGAKEAERRCVSIRSMGGEELKSVHLSAAIEASVGAAETRCDVDRIFETILPTR